MGFDRKGVSALATGSKSRALMMASAAGFALLVSATLPAWPSRAQEQSPATESRLTDEALIARGNALLETGDFASARLLYQAAANQGSGKAAMLAGVTFDPRYLEITGVTGTRPNAKLARQWYALAIKRGDEQASRNDVQLVEWLKKNNVDTEAMAAADEQMSAPTEQSATPPLAQPDAQSAEMASEPAPETEVAEQAPPAEAAAPLDQAGPTLLARPEPESDESTAEMPPADETVNRSPRTGAEQAKAESPVDVSAEPTAFDPRIVRAQLTSAVSNREPVDQLPSPVVVSGGDVDRILFFSEVHDLAGQELSHRWEREGQTVADISFTIGGNSWRMHSSKRITASMTGHWRVVVVDAGGTELASVPFTVE